MSTITIQPITRLLVANRGEIAIRVMRAATELGITTVAIYTYEDRYSLHRYKADESYQIGRNDEPLKPYLDVEGIVRLAKDKRSDAIHPGYGFLSESVVLARRCREEGIIFVGPSPESMEALGDKVRAKQLAVRAGIPTVPDSQTDLTDVETALAEADRIGFPLLIKAAAGGGGRGMRVVRSAGEFSRAFLDARNEAGKAFGDDTVFLERYVTDPKHIEVQLLGDQYGHLIHLYERDCSVQRRFQKVVEIAPSVGLCPEMREKLCDYALRIGREAGYFNAGTVEFLVENEETIYFIEVNPRIQVEHTITEEVTGIDLVRSQLLIAMGHRLSDEGIDIRSQDDIRLNGYAVQCRITTEDPANGFRPDFGIATEIFTNPSEAHEVSKKITKHLFEQSNHPHIKNGEVYVTYLTNLSIDNNVVDAVAVFKSEIKTDFLQFEEKSSNLEIILQQGINLNKLDKGCIIFNYKKEEGYKILTIDSNRYDARYWLEHFLSVDAFQDENFITKKYLKFCQDFAKDVVLPAEDKKEEVMFMNRSVNYFAKNDEFEETNFLNEVLDNPDLIPEFKNYKVEKAPKYSIEDVTNFPIANGAVTDARKKIKNVINLDTNIQIKMDFVNPESAEKFVEKGWDEEKQMYYYLVYFNKEQKS